MSAKRKDWMRELLACQGQPYVWGGKGKLVHTPQGLAAHPWTTCGDVFDCSGLITTTLHRAGGPDWRHTHNAQVLFDVCIPTANHSAPLTLLFYGPSVGNVTHVAVVLFFDAVLGLHKLEAAGGDRGTVTPQRNPWGKARVAVRLEDRQDWLGARSLPAFALEEY